MYSIRAPKAKAIIVESASPTGSASFFIRLDLPQHLAYRLVDMLKWQEADWAAESTQEVRPGRLRQTLSLALKSGRATIKELNAKN